MFLDINDLLPGTGCKLNVHKTFRWHPGHLNVLGTLNLRPVSRWYHKSKNLWVEAVKELSLTYNLSLLYIDKTDYETEKTHFSQDENLVFFTLLIQIPDKDRKLTYLFSHCFFVVPQKVFWSP